MRGLSRLFLLGLLVLSTPASASPDVDFPQPGYSYGGKVRGGPGMNYRQVGSLREGDRILILNGTGAMMNGYEWFQIRYRNGRTGYQWGGLMCSQKPYPTIFRVCNGPSLAAGQPNNGQPNYGQPNNGQPNYGQSYNSQPNYGQPAQNPYPAPVQVNGYNVSQVFHSRGSFSQAGGGQWEELNDQGRVTFRFQEQQRDEWSVYLYDASRNVSLQLDLHRRQILYGVGNAPKSPLYAITNAIADVAPAQPQTGGGYPQPADPNSLTVHYTCAEGLPLTVTYVNSGNGHVIFSIDGSPQTRLEQVVSGSGSRYTNGTYTLYSKGNSASLESPSGLDRCYER
ncbi:MliC family protein [uncultured Roseibium sp.]|uniref:MliC family protein n=1 Tax=uncultured Roseibium sp. TaxID=1936171 RepID=UPI00321776AC